MKGILIDENLPPDLISLVRPGDGMHATALGSRPTDLELWQYAREHDLVILTRDTDFFAKLVLEGPPPQVVWVRCGNQRRAELTGKNRFPILRIAFSTVNAARFGCSSESKVPFKTPIEFKHCSLFVR